MMKNLFYSDFPWKCCSNSTHVNGTQFQQLFHHYPTLEPFYSNFEKEFDPIPLYTLMQRTGYWIPGVALLLYILICTLGPEIMKSCSPCQLKYPLACWNLFLFLFSCYGFLRTGPHLFHRMWFATSFHQVLCESIYISYGGGCVGLLSLIFVFSKILELGDTIFLILKKKPLLFLHVYHHMTVLLFCWNSTLTLSSMAIYFIVMNYFVHSFMYFYFFLQSIHSLPKWFPVWLLTSMQIMQMFLGCLIVGIVYHFKSEEGCLTEYENIYFGLIIYVSYFLCFVHLALKRNCPVLFHQFSILLDTMKKWIVLAVYELDQMFLRAYGWPFELQEVDDHVAHLAVTTVEDTSSPRDTMLLPPPNAVAAVHQSVALGSLSLANHDSLPMYASNNPGTPRPKISSSSSSSFSSSMKVMPIHEDEDDHIQETIPPATAVATGVNNRRSRKKRGAQTYP